MIITIDTDKPLSGSDRLLLSAMLDADPDQPFVKVATEAYEPDPPEPDTDESSILEEAVARAMELVTAKQGNLVKAALTAAGAPTAKALTMENVGTFMEALDNGS